MNKRERERESERERERERERESIYTCISFFDRIVRCCKRLPSVKPNDGRASRTAAWMQDFYDYYY